jgi:hypothetical protein
VVCARCGQEGHGDADCHADSACINCKGQHPAFSKECPEWLKQREITRIKFERNVTYREAADIARASNGHSVTSSKSSYAQATQGPSSLHGKHTVTQDAGTQTMLTWPIDSKTPLSAENLPLTCERTESDVEILRSSAGGKLQSAQNIAEEMPSKTKQIPPTNKNRPTTNSSNTTNNTNKGNLQSSSKKHTPNAPKVRKGDDPIKLHNQFSDLVPDGDLDMEVELYAGSGRKPNNSKSK